MGVLHGDEVLFMFGEPLKLGANFTDAERELSRDVMRYWTNFAKSGSVPLIASFSAFRPGFKNDLRTRSQISKSGDVSCYVKFNLKSISDDVIGQWYFFVNHHLNSCSKHSAIGL